MTDEAEVPLLHADDLLDKDVFDLNGVKLGHVTLCREYEGHVVSFDVALAEDVQRKHHASDAIATLMPDDVVATDFGVSLDEDADRLLHGGIDMPPI